tara:strand:- start:330 stop:752 length:423 start_codon:yes stop_codon:yes gene_type:complete
MNTALKSICFFGSSICLGSAFPYLFGLRPIHKVKIEEWSTGIEDFLVIIFFSGAFSLPLLIPIVMFFGLLKTYRPYFPVNVLATAFFALALSLGWVVVLGLLFNWFRDYQLWGPFVIAPTLSGILIEIMSKPKNQTTTAP